MRPDAIPLTGVELPEACSPERFTRDGSVLMCLDLDDAGLDHWTYDVGRDEKQWQRVSTPPELKLPAWARNYNEVEAAEWAPNGDQIAFVRPNDYGYSGFTSSGEIVVADVDGSDGLIIANDGEIPRWSPDGKRLAFARCRAPTEGLPEDEYVEAFECSLWTAPVDGTKSAELLVEGAASPAFWSPDGRFIAFLRQAGGRETFRRYRILIVPSTGGDSREVGPELVEPSLNGAGLWPGLAWLPDSAPLVVPAKDDVEQDELESQRCVDIWNRARMSPEARGAANVSLVEGRCQVTLRYYGGICSQMPAMPFRYDCPSHGAGIHRINPRFRVWNAQSDHFGKLSLFDPPKGPRLSLPNVPPHPLLDGYVVPFGQDGEPLPELRYTRSVSGSCDDEERGYPVRCFWGHFLHNSCFKQPGRLEVGDIALCPDYWRSPDPMNFLKVQISRDL